MIGTLLLIVGLVLLVAGAAWLLYLAYQDGVALFLATLLIPLFWLYTWLRTWPRSRGAILLQLAGTVAIIAGVRLAPPALLGGSQEQPEVSWSEKRNVRSGPTFGASGGVVEPERSATAPEPEPASGEPGRETRSEAAEAPAPAQRPNDRRPEIVTPDRLEGYVDRYVTVEMRDGERIQGTIERVLSDAVFLRRRIGGGTISFRIDRSEIRQVRVPARRR
jgi:hypothetical protein